MILKREMEVVLEKDKNELWDLAVRVGYLDQVPDPDEATEFDQDSPTTTASKPNKDVFFNETGPQKKEPYLERALKRVNAQEGKGTQLKPTMNGPLLTNITTRNGTASHEEEACSDENTQQLIDDYTSEL